MKKISIAASLLVAAVVVIVACGPQPGPQPPANSVNGTFGFTPSFILAIEGGADGGRPPVIAALVMADRALTSSTGSLCGGGSITPTGPTNILEFILIPDGGVTGTIPMDTTGATGGFSFGISAFIPGDGGSAIGQAAYTAGSLTLTSVTSTTFTGSYSVTGNTADGGAASASGNFNAQTVCSQ